MRLTYHPEAEAELIAAAAYYEERSPGLGARFLADFDETAAGILQAPERWPVLERGLRGRTMRRFPFGVYYRIADAGPRILVVKHHRRHPGYGRDRLFD